MFGTGLRSFMILAIMVSMAVLIAVPGIFHGQAMGAIKYEPGRGSGGWLPAPSCSDTDGGIRPDLAGSIRDSRLNPQTRVDRCIDEQTVDEWYCQGTRSASALTGCSGRCQDGACVETASCALPDVIILTLRVDNSTSNGTVAYEILIYDTGTYTLQQSFELPYQAVDVDARPDGMIAVAQRNPPTIHIYDPQGNHVEEVPLPDPAALLEFIAYDEAGVLYTLRDDSSSHGAVLERFDTDYLIQGSITLPMISPGGLALAASQDAIVVMTREIGEIASTMTSYRWTSSGGFEMSASVRGVISESDGSFAFGGGIDIENGEIHLVESFLPRIEVFDPATLAFKRNYDLPLQYLDLMVISVLGQQGYVGNRQHKTLLAFEQEALVFTKQIDEFMPGNMARTPIAITSTARGTTSIAHDVCTTGRRRCDDGVLVYDCTCGCAQCGTICDVVQNICVPADDAHPIITGPSLLSGPVTLQYGIRIKGSVESCPYDIASVDIVVRNPTDAEDTHRYPLRIEGSAREVDLAKTLSVDDLIGGEYVLYADVTDSSGQRTASDEVPFEVTRLDCTQLHDGGDPQRLLNIIYVGCGYSESETQTYLNDVQTHVDYWMGFVP
ncbi:MAG: hypothetical protein ABIH41_00840, partial [Nanoarchaeota archaeon]